MNRTIIKTKKGFTLLEMLMSVILIGIVLYPLSSLLKINNLNVETTEKMDGSKLNTLISDMIFDASISTSIAFSPEHFAITRLDKCVISYDLDTVKSELKKSYTCPAGVNGKIRSVIVPRIETFTILNTVPTLYDVSIKKEGESFKHNYIIRSN